jgi:hypothetical protein
LGLFILLGGAALCAPQVAGALPGHAATPALQAAKFPGCKPHLTVSGGAAAVAPVGCPKGAFLVSYTADSLTVGPTIHQVLFAVGKHSVALPPCAWQVDFVTAGPVLPVIDSTHRYTALGRFIAGKIGGTPCPTTTTTTIPTSPSSSVLGTSIAPPTTTAGDGTTTRAQVLAATQTLPRTGAPHVGMEAILGLGLMALGGGIVGADRRRRRVTA